MACTVRPWVRWLGTAAGIGAASYAISAGISWRRYGHPPPVTSGEEADSLLDRFMPEYEVVDRHSIRVRASAEIAMLAAEEMDLRQSAIIHSIFRARELVLGARPGAVIRPQPLVAWMKELGWGVLAEIPGREIVFGAVTQPWKTDVVFRALPPIQFGVFREPGYVRIVWTLCAHPTGRASSLFRTETRATATDSFARTRFRRYWAAFSPGIRWIRKVALEQLKGEAERRARAAEDRVARAALRLSPGQWFRRTTHVVIDR